MKRGGGSGRAYKPTDKDRGRVEALAGYGFTIDQIASDLGIGRQALYQHFRQELDVAHIRANALVAQSLFRKATGEGTGAVAAAIFWMKVRCGWREERPETVFVAPPLGKKELAANAAASAGKGSEWADDLAFDGGERLN